MMQARICLFEARPAEKKSLEPGKKEPEPPEPSPRGENPNASGHLDPQPAEPVDVDDEEDAEVLEEPPQDLQEAVKRMLRSSCADEVMSLDWIFGSKMISWSLFGVGFCILLSKVEGWALISYWHYVWIYSLAWHSVSCVFLEMWFWWFQLCTIPTKLICNLRQEILSDHDINDEVMLLFWRVHQTNGFVGKARCCRLLQLASTLGLTKTCHLFPEMQFNTMQIQTCNQNLFFEDYSLHLNGRVLIIFITGYCWHANNFAFLGWRWSPEKLRKMQVFGWTRLSVSWTQWIIVPQDLFEFWEINLNDKWNNFQTPSLWKQRMKQLENAFGMRWTWGRELQNLGLMSCDSSKKWYSKFNCHEWCSQLQGPSLISHCQKKSTSQVNLLNLASTICVVHLPDLTWSKRLTYLKIWASSEASGCKKAFSEWGPGSWAKCHLSLILLQCQDTLDRYPVYDLFCIISIARQLLTLSISWPSIADQMGLLQVSPFGFRLFSFAGCRRCVGLTLVSFSTTWKPSNVFDKWHVERNFEWM